MYARAFLFVQCWRLAFGTWGEPTADSVAKGSLNFRLAQGRAIAYMVLCTVRGYKNDSIRRSGKNGGGGKKYQNGD